MSSAIRPTPAPAAAAPVISASSTSSSAGGRSLKRNWDGGEGSTSSRKININIAGADGRVVTYTIPVDLPMQKLLKRYCDHKKLDYYAMDFICQGHRLQVRRTADELHFEEGEQIDAFVRSDGGGGGGGGAEVETITN